MSFVYSAVTYFMEMKYQTCIFKRKDRGIEFVIWWNLHHKSMDHDNICNMDQTVFFCFYLWESGDRIVFSTYFISDVEKGTER